MYRNMMDNLGRNKQIEEVHTLFKISQEEGLKPDLVLFTELLGAYLRANMPRLAVDIYEEMKQLGHQPNQLIYTILVKGLRRSGESLLASSVMAEFSKAFPEAAKEVEAPKELVFPD
ncbi:hypothetical protein O6H91_13G040800 [Diphasiastrum complanatum]|nr:hypothetical protein O6H91_13G040800 [Diphasiastrum complanatum]